MTRKLLTTKIIHSPSHDPWYNLALEEYLLNLVREGEIILYLWQNEQTVVIGRNQNAWRECDWEQLGRDGGKMARRLSGGGAVYHDLGNLNFTFLTTKKSYDLKKQLGVILHALRNLGIKAEFSGRNDLILDGRKFSGHAYYYQGNQTFHHGAILINTDLDRLSRYLRPSAKKILSKGVDSVRSRVVNLAEASPGLTVSEVKESLVASFSRAYGGRIEFSPHPSDLEILDYYNKYASWEWRFGKSPYFDLTISERFSWGEIEFGFGLRHGRITNCQIYSDAMDEGLIRRLPNLFIGMALEKKVIVSALETFPVRGKEMPLIKDLISWFKYMKI